MISQDILSCETFCRDGSDKIQGQTILNVSKSYTMCEYLKLLRTLNNKFTATFTT